MPGIYTAFFAGAALGGGIGLILNPHTNDIDNFAVGFCGIYAAIIVGALIAPLRLLVTRLLSGLFLFGVLLTSCMGEGPGIDDEARRQTVLVGLLAISAAYATVWLWKKNSKTGVKRER